VFGVLGDLAIRFCLSGVLTSVFAPFTSSLPLLPSSHCHVKQNSMRKSTTIVKRKMGRPAVIGANKFVGLRLSEELLKKIDDWAAHRKVDRSEAIRDLVDQALTAPRGKAK
jgi:hypothetical protein